MIVSVDAAWLRQYAAGVRELASGRACFDNVAITEELGRAARSLEYIAELVEEEDRAEQTHHR